MYSKKRKGDAKMEEKMKVIRQVVKTFKEKSDFEKGLVIGLMINEDFWPRREIDDKTAAEKE